MRIPAASPPVESFCFSRIRYVSLLKASAYPVFRASLKGGHFTFRVSVTTLNLEQSAAASLMEMACGLTLSSSIGGSEGPPPHPDKVRAVVIISRPAAAGSILEKEVGNLFIRKILI